MTTERKTFMDLCLANEIDPEAMAVCAEDWAAQWYDDWDFKTLPESLGLTAEEYHRWLADPDAIREIVEEKRLAMRSGVE